MNEFIKAVEYNIKPILWWLGTVVVCLLIGMALGTFWFHDVIDPPMKVRDTSGDEWTSVDITPQIVSVIDAARRILMQIDLTMDFPAQHEWAKERISNVMVGNGNRDNTGIIYRNDNGIIADSNPTSVKTFDFTSRGGGWFTTLGEIQFNAWSIPLTIQQLANGDYRILTTEEGVGFTVTGAVAVKPKFTPKWSAGYLYGSDGSHTLTIGRDIWQWLAARGEVEMRGNEYAIKGGGEIRW
jgi:hypothetical protein